MSCFTCVTTRIIIEVDNHTPVPVRLHYTISFLLRFTVHDGEQHLSGSFIQLNSVISYDTSLSCFLFLKPTENTNEDNLQI